MPPFRLEVLSDEHDRSSFACGEEALDRYIQTQATQDIRRRIASCFVAVEVETGHLAAFYTIAAAGIPTTELPSDLIKRLSRYPTLPGVRIGRLAVDVKFHGRGLGGSLLADAVNAHYQRVTELTRKAQNWYLTRNFAICEG